MSATLFGVQRIVGQELLAAGWHTSSIAIASKPGSAWVLFDPSRRIRVRMNADFADVMAEATAAYPPGCPLAVPLWRLTVHHAPVSAVIAALCAGRCAHEGGTGRDRRATAAALAAAGMRPDRSRLTRALSGITEWRSPNRNAHARWTAPYRAQAGGWQILTPAAHLDASPGTPASVLTPIITAHQAARTEPHQ